MAVYRLDIAYDGSGFRGYARQAGLRTVQGELESALETLLKSPVEASVAGRTDAGVHALGQVVSFETDHVLAVEQLQRNLNGMIGAEVSVLAVTEASDGFDARFSAKWRRYRYSIGIGPPNPLTRGYVWDVDRPLDMAAVETAVVAFVGEHDFSSFCRSVEGRTNVRNLTELYVERSDRGFDVWAQANAFCHQMVRSIVGHLYDVGRGFSDAAGVRNVIAAKDRSLVATVAPPHGLTLMKVGY